LEDMRRSYGVQGTTGNNSITPSYSNLQDKATGYESIPFAPPRQPVAGARRVALRPLKLLLFLFLFLSSR
jgi:hypothetical protein